MSNEVKALVKAKPEEGLWMETVPVPEPGDDEVLIKVRKSAICGTDVHIWKWDEWSAKTVPVPMVVGHEFCGEIVDGGRAARKYKIGQRVAIDVDAYPDQTFTGRVARIGAAATSSFALLPTPNPSGNFTKVTQRIPVKITFEQRPLPLAPGMMVEVEIDTRDGG